MTSRLSQQRSDLQYQKIYLSLQLNELVASQNVTLSYLKLTIPLAKKSPRQKFKTACLTVLTITRLRMLSRKWKRILETDGKGWLKDEQIMESLQSTFESNVLNLKVAKLEQKLK